MSLCRHVGTCCVLWLSVLVLSVSGRMSYLVSAYATPALMLGVHRLRGAPSFKFKIGSLSMSCLGICL